MKKLKTRKLTMDAMMIALSFVLGYLAIDMGFVKLSFETLPILVGALLFGPMDGMIIGAFGSLLYQFFKYGFSVTTVLWILPYIVLGAIVGRYAGKRGFLINRKQVFFIVTAGQLLLMLMNTAVLYADSKIYGYYTFVYVFGFIILRLVICVALSVAFSVMLPVLLRSLRSSLHLWDVEVTFAKSHFFKFGDSYGSRRYQKTSQKRKDSCPGQPGSKAAGGDVVPDCGTYPGLERISGGEDDPYLSCHPRGSASE